MNKLIVMMSVLVMIVSANVNAAPAQHQPVAKKSIQMEGDGGAVEPDKGDGCGLGWQVTQKRSMIATTTRGTTNGFVPPTFGMTSGTIGCEQHSFARKEAPAVNFVATNYEPLMLEMAQGKGEYLTALGRTMGCSDSAISAFGKMSQQKYPNIVGTESNAVDMYKNVKKEIKADPFLSSACNS